MSRASREGPQIIETLLTTEMPKSRPDTFLPPLTMATRQEIIVRSSDLFVGPLINLSHITSAKDSRLLASTLVTLSSNNNSHLVDR